MGNGASMRHYSYHFRFSILPYTQRKRIDRMRSGEQLQRRTGKQVVPAFGSNPDKRTRNLHILVSAGVYPGCGQY